MFTQDYRPRTFAEVRGNAIPLQVLRSICTHPADAPRCFLFQGSPGTGKTSCARILPRALNCRKKKADACGECEQCLLTEFDPRYQEYDVSFVGRVDVMRDIASTFSTSLTSGYRVIVFDEMQMASKEAQSALLKPLDEASSDTFFVFCTTEREKIIKTIRSRCIELEFEPLSTTQLSDLLKDILVKENKTASSEVLTRIIRRSGGDARFAVSRLETFFLLSEEEFLINMKMADGLIKDLFTVLFEPDFDSDRFRAIVGQLVRFPCEHLRQDFEAMMLAMADKIYVQRADGLRKMESVLRQWLITQQYLRGSNDWSIFFFSLRGFF